MGRVNTQVLVRNSLLVAGAAALHVVEAALPNPFYLLLGPGAKLGLANIVTLAVVLAYGTKQATIIAALRALLGGLLGGTFLTFGFFLSFAGAVTSALAMGYVRRLGGARVSAIGLSMLGAVTHNVTQLLVAALLVNHFGLMVHLPYLLFFAVPTGYFVGLVGAMLYRYLPKEVLRNGAFRKI
ncbi:MAG: Gx transporter family protein [Firmicutes bacterium]|nr:Gx transporter family protein [Dethiobacter sp.]MBS3888924.1 Gx transporter family protein [Bacillota bacterium]MBS4053544.1 Gx transporter family protein [Thermaerobacter sp.]